MQVNYAAAAAAEHWRKQTSCLYLPTKHTHWKYWYIERADDRRKKGKKEQKTANILFYTFYSAAAAAATTSTSLLNNFWLAPSPNTGFFAMPKRLEYAIDYANEYLYVCKYMHLLGSMEMCTNPVFSLYLYFFVFQDSITRLNASLYLHLHCSIY